MIHHVTDCATGVETVTEIDGPARPIAGRAIHEVGAERGHRRGELRAAAKAAKPKQIKTVNDLVTLLVATGKLDPLEAEAVGWTLVKGGK